MRYKLPSPNITFYLRAAGVYDKALALCTNALELDKFNHIIAFQRAETFFVRLPSFLSVFLPLCYL